jgi:hypothetical protein
MKFGLYPGDIIISKFWVGWGYKGAYQTQTGPYRIETISGPCTCAPPNPRWNQYCILPVQPHYHMEVTDVRPDISFNRKKDGSFKKGGCYLNHHYEREDGRFVGLDTWDYLNDKPTDRPLDEIFLVERPALKPGTQFDLFK